MPTPTNTGITTSTPVVIASTQPSPNIVYNAPRTTPPTGLPSSTSVFLRQRMEDTIRFYGPDGRAKWDIDVHRSHGKGEIHVHEWTDGIRKGAITLGEYLRRLTVSPVFFINPCIMNPTICRGPIVFTEGNN